MAAYTTVLEDLAVRCAASGLDLVQPLQAGWYNDVVREENRLPDFGDSRTVVILIGNSRRLWPKMISTLKRRADLLEHTDPVDAYVEETINAAVRATHADALVRWAHRPQPRHIAIQTMAEIAGLAWRSPASLSIHRVYGPWIGLRAAIVLPLPGPEERPLPAPACESCPSACRKVLDEVSRHQTRHWKHDLAIRDACPVGRQYRYSDLQIEYHYTKHRTALAKAIGAVQS